MSPNVVLMESSTLAWDSMARNRGSNFCMPVVGIASTKGAEPGSANVELAIAEGGRIEVLANLNKVEIRKILEPNGNGIDQCAAPTHHST